MLISELSVLIALFIILLRELRGCGGNTRDSTYNPLKAINLKEEDSKLTEKVDALTASVRKALNKSKEKDQEIGKIRKQFEVLEDRIEKLEEHLYPSKEPIVKSFKSM